MASAPAASWITFVPEEDTSIRGRYVSLRPARCAGLLSISKPSGMLPPDSPARRGLANFRERASAFSMLGAGKQRHPFAAAVIAVVVARMTSTATTAHPVRYRLTLSAK